MDKEIIKTIVECTDDNPNMFNIENRQTAYIGYKIVTNLRTIFFGMTADAECCENFGYLTSEDDLEDFLETELISISYINDCLDKLYINLDEAYKYDAFEDPAIVFINLETSNGTLQFAAYNSHNGYYAHRVVMAVNDQEKHSYSI